MRCVAVMTLTFILASVGFAKHKEHKPKEETKKFKPVRFIEAHCNLQTNVCDCYNPVEVARDVDGTRIFQCRVRPKK